MAVKWGAEALLVEVVANETDATTKDEQAVEGANLGTNISNPTYYQASIWGLP